MPPPAGTPCRPHEEPSAQRAGRVKAAAALRAVARSASLDAARPMGDPAAERTQLLIRLPQLAVFTFERLDALALVRCRPGPQALVTLGPPYPVAQCLARAADLLGNRVDRRPLRSVLGFVVQDHPNRASTDLRR